MHPLLIAALVWVGAVVVIVFFLKRHFSKKHVDQLPGFHEAFMGEMKVVKVDENSYV